MKLEELIALGLQAHRDSMSLNPRQIAEIEIGGNVQILTYVAGIMIERDRTRLVTSGRKHTYQREGLPMPLGDQSLTIEIKDIVSYRVIENLE